MEYKPFCYPPNYEIAELHSNATRPGIEDTSAIDCPCCGRKPCRPYTSWLTKDISKDFGKNGSAFATYFMLLRFYSATILLVILMFSAYMAYETYRHCSRSSSEVCVNAFGVWIVSFRDLTKLMQQEHHSAIDELNTELLVLYLLRSFVFVLLLFLNSYLLYKVQQQSLREDRRGFESYSLLMRNIDMNWKEHDLREEVVQRCPEVRIHQLFFLHQTHSYKRLFDTRNETYFRWRASSSEKERASLLRLLEAYEKQLEKEGQKLNNPTGRAIIVFERMSHRDKVQAAYSGNLCYRILKGMGFQTQNALYAQDISRPQEIYWHNIGESTRKRTAMIIMEYLTIMVTLALSYLLLSRGLRISDSKSVQREVQLKDELFVMGVAVAVVVLGILFRKLMVVIAEWRKPNTRTSKALFIVSTSILFHLIYYAIIPTIYFTYYEQEMVSKKLLSIGVQVLFFLLIQFLLSAFDVFFCMWNRRRNKIMREGAAGAWQRKLHTLLEYPSFPLQLKLMLLFKSWTFVLFYAFELPYILGMVLLLFLYLYFSDKRNLYMHYRKEHVGSRVQYIFLRIYSNFFTIFLCFLYCWSQYRSYQLAAAIGLSLFAICFQLFYKPKKNIHDDDIDVSELEGVGYRTYYEEYLKEINSEELDSEIRQCLRERAERASSTDRSVEDHSSVKRGRDSLLISDSLADISTHLIGKD